MSAQAGTWNFDGLAADGDLLRTISSRLEGQGPDGEMIYCDSGIGLLVRPFHTTPESRFEQQPFISVSGNTIIWDGRLDNRNELISDLGDYITADRTDGALAAAAFERWGTDSFARLLGDWTITVWSRRRQALILARDYIGVRRLYYHPKAGGVIWCSDLAVLVHCGENLSLSEEYIAGYLAHRPAAELTPYNEIYSVPPGKFVRIRPSGSTIHSHWTFDPNRRTTYRTDAEYEDHFCHLFRDAVRHRLRSHSAILADLSGGLDSSSIVCMADAIISTGEGDAPRLDTFSFCDRNEPGEDDFLYFSKVEDQRRRVGYHAEATAAGDAFSFDPKAFAPIPGFGPRPEFAKAKADVISRGKYLVSLSGLGGDEFLGQTLDPRVQMADLLVQLRFRQLRSALNQWSMIMRFPWIRLALETFVLSLPTSIRARLCHPKSLDPWINTRFAQRYEFCARRLVAAAGSWSWLPSSRDAYQTYINVSRQLTHMTSSIEEKRYPFLDQRLVEFLMSIPTSQLVRPGDRRSLMRRALKNMLPTDIACRKSKASTGRCVSLTLGKHREWLDEMLVAPLSHDLGFLEQAGFVGSLMASRNGQLPQSIVRLLRALALELWLREARARSVLSFQPSENRCGQGNRSPAMSSPSAANKIGGIHGCEPAK